MTNDQDSNHRLIIFPYKALGLSLDRPTGQFTMQRAPIGKV